MEGGQGWQAFPCFSAADPFGFLSSLCICCILRLLTIKWRGWREFSCFSADYPLGFLSSLCLCCILRLRHTIKWLVWREFSCLIQSINMSLYLRSHFAAFYVSTPLNDKVYRNFHVLVHFSHFRLVFSTFSLLHYTFPHHQISRLTIMFVF